VQSETVFQGSSCQLALEDAVGILSVARPPVNALDQALIADLGAAARVVAADTRFRALVICGVPRFFAAGADIKEMAAMTYQEMSVASVGMEESFAALAGLAVPVVAAVTGFALGGGCELALCADLRVAGEGAKFGQPEVLLGLIPGLGGTQRLARLVGPSRAKDLILTGRTVGAQEAFTLGLVDRVVPDAEVQDVAMALARGFAAGAPVALAAAKRAIDLGLGVDLATGLAIERSEFAGLFATEDRRIGLASFIADGPGKAQFTGR
jgi:enoyl-CoA hydratase/carnithine racemase